MSGHPVHGYNEVRLDGLCIPRAEGRAHVSKGAPTRGLVEDVRSGVTEQQLHEELK